MDAPDDYLQMSGIQHFAFCRRQWALIHLEQQWAENLRTTEGQLNHARCHDDTRTERRGDLLITRGMRVTSHRLRMSGNCDVVEFRACADGIPLQSTPGRWQPYPVEYKHGHAKETRCRPAAIMRTGHGAGGNAGVPYPGRGAVLLRDEAAGGRTFYR